jgi:hypothetical protein
MERISGLLKNKLACELLTVKATGKNIFDKNQKRERRWFKEV